MPLRTGKNYARKQRRIAKYGKYRKLAGMSKAIVRTSTGKFKRTLIPRYVNPFRKDYEMVQLQYNQVITLDPNPNDLNGSNMWVFHANNVFDPDRTGTGNQPTYFDNYALTFNRYHVTFSKIKVTVVNHGVNTAVWNGTAVVSQPNQSYRLAIQRDATEGDFAPSMDALIMQDATNVKWRYVGPSLTGKLPSLSMKCAPHKQVGTAYNDDTLLANTNSGPSRAVFWRVMVASADGTTDPPNGLRLQVQIKYYVRFFDRITNQPIN